MIWVDYAILVIIVLSALISVLRGFVRESLSLAGWVLAFWVALTFTRDLALHLEAYISVPSVRLVVAFLVLFFSALLLTMLVNFLAGQLVDKTGLTGTDRMLGVVFGTARGCVIVAILVLLAGFTSVPRDPWWQESTFIHQFQELAVWIRGFLPPDIAAKIGY
ncbi:MAG: CvpA family protein [Gammaproteobacteria bacterium]|nr:CvpA family protein [Gammaproteobacteria bacterium]